MKPMRGASCRRTAQPNIALKSPPRRDAADLAKIFRFLLFQLCGGLMGYWLLALPNPACMRLIYIGLVATKKRLVGYDHNLRHVVQLLGWLKDADQTKYPTAWSVGQKGNDYGHPRLLRQQRPGPLTVNSGCKVHISHSGLAVNFLVLLDAVGRIEWCNRDNGRITSGSIRNTASNNTVSNHRCAVNALSGLPSPR
ncbi:MAG: hypothetical protein IPO19_13305 [Rhodoferax sp.]|nr:hypothetical protein [Rhodoferax sp.]